MSHVSHYEILEKIGQGGMGEVYRARDTRLERDVALKFLSLDFTGSDSLKERFIQEAKRASALDHQNICRIHAIEETDDGRLFIDMGYYQGETVKAKLRQGSLTWQEIVDLAVQIAAGLQAAHNRNIIHLDIKPANIMVTPDGVVKILDFGLSRYTSEIDRTRPKGPLMGTVAYMAPELVKGEETGPESDLWALGVLMYEMATGGRPFQGKNDMAVLYAIVHKDCAPPCEKAPDLPEELGRMIRRALVKDRRQRYQSAGEILADLEPLQQQSSQTNLIQPPKGLRQKLLPRALAVAMLLLLLIIGKYIRDLINPPSPQDPLSTDVVLVGFENGPGDQRDAWVGVALSEMIMFRLPVNERFHWIANAEIVLPGRSVFESRVGFDPTTRRHLRDQSVEWALGGSFHLVEERAGDGIEIEVELQDTATGKIKKQTEKGLVSELPEVADRIAAFLVPDLEGTAPALEPFDGAAEAPRDPKAVRLLEEAQRKLRVREAKVALANLVEAIEIEPESPILHLTLSEAYFQLYRDREAQLAAQDAIEKVRKLPWRDQIYYLAWRLDLQGDLDGAAAVFRVWWAAADLAERAADPLALDRGIQVGTALAEARQSAAALAVVEKLRPLLAGDPRVPMIEVGAFRDERLEDEKAAAIRAVELARERDAPLLEARALVMEAQVWQRQGEYDKGVEDAEAARKIYSLRGYKGGEADAITALGNLEQDQRNYLGAKTSFGTAAQLYSEIGSRTHRARVLFNMAVVYDARGELGAAIEVTRQAMPLFVEAGYRDGQVVAQLNIVDYESALGQFAEAEKTFQKAVDILAHWRNSRLDALALIRRGHLKAQQGLLPDARQTLTQALAAQETVQDQLWIAYTRHLLGQVLYDQGHLTEAMQSLQAALEGYGENADILADMGRCLMAMGDLDGAREQFSRALETQSNESDPGPAAQTRLYQAQLLYYQARLGYGGSRIEESVETARGVLQDLAENPDFLLLRAQAHVILGTGLLAMGEAGKAQQELDRARGLLADVKSPLYELPLEILAARIMAFHGDPGARGHLHDLLAKAMNHELRLMELEIQQVLGEITLGKTGRNQLEDLAKEARQRGYGLIALLAERSAAAKAGAELSFHSDTQIDLMR